MPINPFPRWFRKSQKTIDTLKKKLSSLAQKNETEEKKEEVIFKSTQIKAPQEVKVTVSIGSVIKASLAILAVLGLVYLLSWIKSIIILFLVALFLATIFGPSVDRLQRFRIPRALGIVLMYILVIGVFAMIFSSLVPILAGELSTLATSVKDMIQNVLTNPSPHSWLLTKLQPTLQEVWKSVDQTQIVNDLTSSINSVASRLTDFAGNAVGAVFTIFNGLFNLILVMVVTFFMILNKKHTRDFFNSLFPSRYSDYINLKMQQITKRIGRWVQGQLMMGVSMGCLVLVVFWIIGIKYALTLAMVAAIGEFIPFFGPIITFSSALLIALNQDPILVLWLIPAYAIVMFIESNVFVPIIIGRSSGLNPIVIMFAMFSFATIGAKFGESLGVGLIGMMLAVPIADIISIFVEDYRDKKK